MPAPVPFRRIRKLLESNGWTLARINGSHHIFTGPGRPTLSVPVHNNEVKAVYERKVRQAIEDLERGKEDDAAG
jgi:predicted RNA binding protein YcfA (HicA-like mRNA interferase family)